MARDVPLVRDQTAGDKQKDHNFVGCVYVLISHNISLVGWSSPDKGLKSPIKILESINVL